ncbi:hypothetical protein GTQ40_12420 [Flavobacteriaceae bacterium R38]|nr:hypothetical protein [Flavobacteriaceae bacterium R38]
MKDNIKLLSVIGVMILLFTSSPLYAQDTSVSGPTIVIQGRTEVYSVSGVSNLTSTTWSTSSNAQVVSGSTYSASIKFNSTGTGYVEAFSVDSFFGFYSTTLGVEVIADIPPNPGNPSVSNNNCGQATLTRSSNPPHGITWYWQGKNANGASTALGSGSTFIANQGSGTYYIRARNSSGNWSTGSGSVYVNINSGTIWYADSDGDSYGDASVTTVSCTQPIGYVSNDDDYDDSTINITNIAPQTFYQDNDGDGLGNFNSSVLYSIRPNGYVTNSDDCDDTNSAYTLPKIWYEDLDGDGLGDPNSPSGLVCVAPSGYVDDNTDNCPNQNDPTNQCGSTTSTDNNEGNYVYTRTYQEATNTPYDNLFSQDDRLIQQITYFDGLGRAIQQNAIGQSASKKDIVTPMEYDIFGRQVKQYLPYSTTEATGNYRVNALAEASAHYNTAKYDYTDNNYSETRFENSPLNRPLQQAAPGNPWAMGSGHEIQFEYLTNITDEVIYFDVVFDQNNTEFPQLKRDGSYIQGELSKVITKDENWSSGKDHTTEEFKDKQGRVVLKRTYDNEIAHDTYYVYDDFGNLSFVLPPKLSEEFAGLPVTFDRNTIARDSYTVGDFIDELGYQYKYDYRNRLIEKKIPGKGWEYIVYNKLDQPIMTQDPNLQAQGKWLFTKYDPFGRVAYTGIVLNSGDRTTVQAAADAAIKQYVTSSSSANTIGGAVIFYTQEGYPQLGANDEVFTANYYDDYRFTGHITFPLSTPSTAIQGQSVNLQVKGQATGALVRVLDSDDWIYSLTSYDNKLRPIYAASYNEALQTTDIVESVIDFLGRPLKTRSSHIKNGTTIVTLDNFSYDHAGRLISQTQCLGDENLGFACETGDPAPANPVLQSAINTSTITVGAESISLNDGFEVYASNDLSYTARIASVVTSNGTSPEELIVYNIYDELGRMDAKKVGGRVDPLGVTATNGLQTVNYTYNVRDWLTGINDVNNLGNDLFSFKIGYNDPTSGTALYNGNISQTHWKTANTDNSLKNYTYTYDALNRIKSGIDNTGNYNLSNITYDKMGNILSLQRQGHINADATLFGEMDDLVYTYDSGNKLTKVVDNGNATYGFKDGTNTNDDFEYDDNGNMVIDRNKGITSITYNHLNLPTHVVLPDGNIQYIYDAAGVKIKKIVNNTAVSSLTTTEYAGNYIYENDLLQFFNTAEGYIEPNGSSYDYIYQYKDHLGNIRLSYSDTDGNGSVNTSEIKEENNYYPFGLKHKGYNGNIVGRNHKYGFTGKEEQDELGLEWVDITARNYDPALGRWMNLDPLAELMRRHSPYNYAFDNPIYFMDPDGMMPQGGGCCGDGKKKPFSRFTPRTQTLDGDLLTLSVSLKAKFASIGTDVSLGKSAKAGFELSVAQGSATGTLNSSGELEGSGKVKILSARAGISIDGVGESNVNASVGEIQGKINSEDGFSGTVSILDVTGNATTKNGVTVSDGFTAVEGDMKTGEVNTGVVKGGSMQAVNSDNIGATFKKNEVGIVAKAGPARVTAKVNTKTFMQKVNNFLNGIGDLIFNGPKVSPSAEDLKDANIN